MKEWIVADREHLGVVPRIRDTRISISLLLELLSSGMTIPEIVKERRSLSAEAFRGPLEESIQAKVRFL